MATIIDGVTTAQEIKEEIARKVSLISEQGGKIPHLAAVLVGDDGASHTVWHHAIAGEIRYRDGGQTLRGNRQK